MRAVAVARRVVGRSCLDAADDPFGYQIEVGMLDGDGMEWGCVDEITTMSEDIEPPKGEGRYSRT